MNMHSTSQTIRPAGSPTAMLAKAILCAALVVAAAWIGFARFGGEAVTDPSVNEAGASAGAAAGVVIHGDRAAAHRQQVFEERRARFDPHPQTHVAGSTDVESPAP